MRESGQRQRLAAILAADVVGYSRLMEGDERATVESLEAARAVFRAEVKANGGRVVDTSGDSVLALFDSAAGAVVAALAVQRTLEDASAGLPEERRMRFRIGVHLGDVISSDDGTVYGDGVNIGARLQAAAEPGGVLVSEAVRGAVKGRLAAVFEDRGVQTVKNISEPIRAWTVRLAARPVDPAPGATAPASVATVAAAPPRRSRRALALAAVLLLGAAALVIWWLRPAPVSPRAGAFPASTPAVATSPVVSGKASIAVLPFDNMSGDAEQAYFADGITEDLITDLSKVGGLFVIARNSTFAYKGKAHDVREIAQALGVRYLLEGSVRKSGSEIRVNTQLIDATTGGHIWADRYDGDLKNIFGLQDTVTRNVVKALAVELTKNDSDRVSTRGTRNAEAYDVFLKGWERYQRRTPEDFRAAIVDFKKAVELDPNYGRGYAALAAIDWESFTRFWGPAVQLGPRNEDALYGAEQYLARAMREPTPLAHQVASAMQLQAQQHDEALAEAKRSIESDPNDANGYIALAGALSFSGRPDQALEAVDRAMRLNPHYPSSYLYQRGLAQFAAGRGDETVASLERAIAMNADDYWSQRLLLAAYGQVGRDADARRLYASMKSRKDARGQWAYMDPLTIKAVTYWYPFTRSSDVQRFSAGLAKAGVPE
jgi:TolB-like protein/class 3 adenylate cyclase/Tfp pilus assembly protein PilF